MTKLKLKQFDLNLDNLRDRILSTIFSQAVWNAIEISISNFGL